MVVDGEVDEAFMRSLVVPQLGRCRGRVPVSKKSGQGYRYCTDMMSFQLLFSVTIGIVDRFFELILVRKK